LQFSSTIDLNKWLVLNGWALTYREYSLDYIDAENEAGATRDGIWQGTFENPWNWRKRERGETGGKSEHRADVPKDKPRPIEGTCGEKRTCEEMTSCDEAQFYLVRCSVQSLDGDGDGTSCENLCR
jgi:hypothetical protein